jgi:hypothetical protein
LGHLHIDEYESDSNTIKREFSHIQMHEEFRKGNQSADADIALLRMKEPVSFSISVRPVCLPSPNEKIDSISGTVIGYGKNQYGILEKLPKVIDMNTISLISCYRRNKEYVDIASDRSFCAGDTDQVPCQGELNLFIF